MILQFGNYSLYLIYWNCKTKTYISLYSSGSINNRVHSNDFTKTVNKRSSAVSSIDCSICLNHIKIKPVFYWFKV